jgi:transcription-repair coupling factor (superfamily II helicase)
LEDLKNGKVDIIIGTHQLVSSSVKFKDLGLLIIDEEHKFGVSVKDKLKTLKNNVDTLTLTATPIPRTLQFSLMAARDLSVIKTPPPNRQPVDTQLIGFNEEIFVMPFLMSCRETDRCILSITELKTLKILPGLSSVWFRMRE